MNKLNFGIVGTGFIAGLIAPAIHSSQYARLVAVSSRSKEKADSFAAQYPGAVGVQGVEELMAQSDVQAVYVAAPTSAKEDIAARALSAGKHVLIEKPLQSKEVAERLTALARQNGVVLMDATHFVHHARTRAMRERMPQLIGEPRSLHTMFYFPFSDRENIRFDQSEEPMGAIGDMAWYSMRAAVEFLSPGQLKDIRVFAERDAQTNAVIRATGLLAFEGGKTTTFDVGYTTGTAVMDLTLGGTSGVLAQDDFVLDWNSGFAFDNPDISTGFTHRTGMATRNDISFIETPGTKPQHALMIDSFAQLALEPDAEQRLQWMEATVQTQSLLDAVWNAAEAN
ncbi:Gfo/Idh/MocA family oxidoreductase [Rhizobium sp. RM]|uniref:Gfo/Idh/MocA family protein n=1 Tax=Rhizobium sp. RM TaxID=2748079 RepID=UPI00110DA702|nr:Gfo/Idh/MocA family oxidoreductase [Rhizobium sp. RM]NWJ27643.1 Gfo/Idh/MocA family oxidoreductase [Rhizobium sp. RM]TMV18913.1 Gfo/Idh/MocA family oxidoreductase [Rhizobium sp. Td3]